MPAVKPQSPANDLIEGLSRKDRTKILAGCEPVDLAYGDILCEPDSVLRHVYFPISGCISLVAAVAGHKPLEMGMIGREGMLGATLVLGINTAPMRAVVQGAGVALRTSASRFKRELRDTPALSLALNRYLYVLMAQLSQTLICARFHSIEARLARWLLMMHDRAHTHHIHLKHEFLADMLGVRRSAVTIAAGSLQKLGIIRYARGDISILDRHRLEAISCECYAALIDDYSRLAS